MYSRYRMDGNVKWKLTRHVAQNKVIMILTGFSTEPNSSNMQSAAGVCVHSANTWRRRRAVPCAHSKGGNEDNTEHYNVRLTDLKQLPRYYYYYYLYLLHTGYSPVCPQTNHVPRGYTVAATLSFYCQYAVWCVSPSFLRWF